MPKDGELRSMKAEQQYIDLFTQYEDLICRKSVPVLNALRAQAFADFERLGFPSLKGEDYKYKGFCSRLWDQYQSAEYSGQSV